MPLESREKEYEKMVYQSDTCSYMCILKRYKHMHIHIIIVGSGAPCLSQPPR